MKVFTWLYFSCGVLCTTGFISLLLDQLGYIDTGSNPNDDTKTIALTVVLLIPSVLFLFFPLIFKQKQNEKIN